MKSEFNLEAKKLFAEFNKDLQLVREIEIKANRVPQLEKHILSLREDTVQLKAMENSI